ncbi:hypothetical protein D1872_195400 [compost metagenome]
MPSSTILNGTRVRINSRITSSSVGFNSVPEARLAMYRSSIRLLYSGADILRCVESASTSGLEETASFRESGTPSLPVLEAKSITLFFCSGRAIEVGTIHSSGLPDDIGVGTLSSDFTLCFCNGPVIASVAEILFKSFVLSIALSLLE